MRGWGIWSSPSQLAYRCNVDYHIEKALARDVKNGWLEAPEDVRDMEQRMIGLCTVVLRATKLSPTIPTVSVTVTVYQGQWVTEISRSHVCRCGFSNMNQGAQEFIKIQTQSSGTFISTNRQQRLIRTWNHSSSQHIRDDSPLAPSEIIMAEGGCRKYTLGLASTKLTFDTQLNSVRKMHHLIQWRASIQGKTTLAPPSPRDLKPL